MELERRDFRATIYYDFDRGLTQEECFQQLVKTFSDALPSGATVCGWLRNLEGAGRACKMTRTQEGPQQHYCPKPSLL